MSITIVGLGPGDPGLITRQAWQIISEANVLHLRTARHPVTVGLPAGVRLIIFALFEGVLVLINDDLNIQTH